jgi:hypothetical protein
MEPLPDQEAVSPYCSFSSVNYHEPSTGTNQKRTLALIRTSDNTGYYVDIYHSDNKEKNEYLYHNLGQSISIFDREDNPIAKHPTVELSEHTDGYGPGYKLFEDKRSTNIYGNDVKAQFCLKKEGKEDVFMDMHIAGGEDREYFTAMAPKSYTAPAEYQLLPNPVAIVRHHGEAWKNPFMVVYESYTGDGTNTIRSVSGESDGETSILKVKGDHGKQTIIQSFSKKAWEKEGEIFAGHFGVISYQNEKLSYLYLGDGTRISAGKHSIEAIGKKKISAYLEIRDDKIILSSNEEVKLHLPASSEKIFIEHAGERTELKAKKAPNGLWMIELPEVRDAIITF